MAPTTCDQVTARFEHLRYNSSALPLLVQGELVVLSICTSLLIVSALLTIVLKVTNKNSAYLQSRPLPLTLLSHAGVQLQLIIGSYSHVVSGMLPCPFTIIAPMLIIPMIALPIVIRLNMFFRKLFLAKRVAGVRAAYMSGDYEPQDIPLITTNNNNDASPQQPQPPQQPPPHATRFHNAMNVLSDTFMAGTNMSSNNNHVRVTRWMASSTGIWVQFSLLFAPFVLASLLLMTINPDYATPCFGCVYTNGAAIAIEVLGAICIVYLAAVWRSSCKHLKDSDPFQILTEVRIQLVLGGLALLAYVLNESTEIEYNGGPDGFTFNYFIAIFLTLATLCAGLFVDIVALRHEVGLWLGDLPTTTSSPPPPPTNNAAGLALNGGIIPHNNIGGKSSEHSQSDVVDEENPTLSPRTLFAMAKQLSFTATRVRLNFTELLNVLLDETKPHEEFEKYLASEWASESLSFLDSVKEWKSNYLTNSEQTNALRARKIVKLFVGYQAEFPINISSEQVETLLRSVPLAGAGGAGSGKNTTYSSDLGSNIDVPMTVFDDAVVEIRKMLEYGPVPRFSRTKVFRGMVDDGTISEMKILRPKSVLFSNLVLAGSSISGAAEA